MMVKKNKQEKIVYLVFFILIFCIVLYKINQANLIYIIDDEFGYWGVAAWLSGYDWSGVMKHCAYYSFGYGFLLSFIIRVVGNTSVAYKIAIVLNGLFLYFIFLIAYKIVRSSFADKLSGLQMTILSAFVTLLPNHVYQAGVAWPELLLSLIVWICFYCVFLYLSKGEVKYLIVASFILGYAYMVHNRMLALLGVFVGFLLYQIYLKRISCKNLIFMLLILGAAVGLGAIIKQYLYQLLWRGSMAGSDNSYKSLLTKLLKCLVSGWKGIKTLAIELCGKLFYFIIASYSFIIYALVGIKKCDSKTKQLSAFVFLGFLFEVLLTELQMSLSKSNSLNKLFYGRYAEIFVGVIILCIFMMFKEQTISLKTVIFTCCVSILFLTVTTIILNKYIKENNLFVFGRMNSIFLSPYWQSNRLHLFIAVLVSLFIGTFFIITSNKTVKMTVLIIIAILNILTAKSSLNNTYFEFQKSHTMIDEITLYIKELDAEGIYYVLNGNNVWENRISDLLQFKNPKIPIECIDNNKHAENKNYYIVINKNTEQEMEFIYKGYHPICELEQISILKYGRPLENEYASIYNYELGGNARTQGDMIMTTGVGGHVVIAKVNFREGEYQLHVYTNQETDESADKKEIGFVYLEKENMNQTLGNLYSNTSKADFSFKITEAGEYKINIYVYEDYIVGLEDLQIEKRSEE